MTYGDYYTAYRNKESVKKKPGKLTKVLYSIAVTYIVSTAICFLLENKEYNNLNSAKYNNARANVDDRGIQERCSELAKTRTFMGFLSASPRVIFGTGKGARKG